MARRSTTTKHNPAKMGLFLLVLGIVGFAIELGYVNVPFWPTLLVVAGLWKIAMSKV